MICVTEPNSDSKEVRTARYQWTQPQCEICFRRDNPEKDPARLKSPESERCVTCGLWNQDGIYIRIDPAEAPYPSLLKDPTPTGEMKEDF